MAATNYLAVQVDVQNDGKSRYKDPEHLDLIYIHTKHITHACMHA